MRPRQVVDKVREIYLDGQRLRRKQKPLVIRKLPFLLTLLVGGILGGAGGYFIYQRLLVGIGVGLCISFVLFFVFVIEDQL